MKLRPLQKSYVPTEQDCKKKWWLVNVDGKILGKAATVIANLLRGKQKYFFTGQQDCGDYVTVINARKIKLSKNKMDTKSYHWHTGYGAGLRTRTARQLLEKKPEKILYDAVWGMLPRNKSRKHLMRKLHISPGPEHTNSAQKPEPIQL